MKMDPGESEWITHTNCLGGWV